MPSKDKGLCWDALEKYDIRYEANEIQRLIEHQINERHRQSRTNLIYELICSAVSKLNELADKMDPYP